MFIRKISVTLISFCAALSNAANFTVANTSDKPINVGFQVPAKTVAHIYLKPIEELKKLSQQELQNELIKSVMHDDPAAIKKLISAGAKTVYYHPDGHQQNAIAIAVNYKKEQAIDTFLELGFIVDYGNIHRLLHSHERWNNKKLWSLVLKSPQFSKNLEGLIISLSGYFYNASPEEFKQILQDCIAAGLNIGKLWEQFLYSNYDFLSPSMLKVLLDLGANPNQCTTIGNSNKLPLCVMVDKGCLESVEILIESSADLDNCSHRWKSTYLSPIQYMFMENKKMLKSLAERGLDLSYLLA